MAATGTTYATGAERQAGDLRQRGAPELVVNGQPVGLDADDKKKLQVRLPLTVNTMCIALT